MAVIRLPNGKWEYDPNQPLGEPGGFGAVYVGTGEGHGKLAIKRLHISAEAAAHRELKIADDLAGRDLKYVIPIYDSGEDAEAGGYFVVMARAEQSLADQIAAKGLLSEDEAIPILLSIAHGLEEIGHICHRDLKPANVLYHDGEWKLADFGIARFVEEATSSQTLKGFLTPPYGAPEQWQGKRATAATDVYALGCIAYACLTGQPPFIGPTPEDYQEQHLNMPPPRLEQVASSLASRILLMLRKAPDARPPIKRVIQLLEQEASADKPEDTAAAALAQADVEIGQEYAEAEAKKAAEQTAHNERQALANEGLAILGELMQEVFAQAAVKAPNAKVQGTLTQGTITLGRGSLRWTVVNPLIGEQHFSEAGWNVVAGAMIEVRQSPHFPAWEGRSASLWYTDLNDGNGFRWIEIPYMYTPLMSRVSPPIEPFAAENLDVASMAAGPGAGNYQNAAKPMPIDAEDYESFKNRWLERLAEASRCQLTRPSRLPER